MRRITIFVRVIIIVSLLFMLIVSVCCDSIKEARMLEIEQQKGVERRHKLRKEESQQLFMYSRTSKVGRYEIFQDQQLAKNTFLFDTMDGRIWILTQDQETKKLCWIELDVENRGPYTKYD